MMESERKEVVGKHSVQTATRKCFTRSPSSGDRIFIGREGIDRRLREIIERETKANGISRSDLVRAIELSFLYNRDSVAVWVGQALRNLRMLGDAERVAGIGLFRQTLERNWGIPPDVSESIIQIIPNFMMDDLVEVLWADGTGRNCVEECCCSILNYYNGTQGGMTE